MTYKQQKQQALYETREHSDCTFIFPSTNTKIKAHKLLLTLCSPVFERMLYGNLGRNEILIEDIEPDVFDKFLRYIYTGSVQIDDVLEAWHLFYVAQKYFLLELQEQCLSHVKTNLTISNLMMCYEYATLYSQDSLAQQCLDDIWSFGKGLLLCSNYHPQSETIRAIARQDSLESALLTVNWAIGECDNPSLESVVQLLNERKLQVCKHFVDPRLYKAVDRDKQDAIELYNDLTSNGVQVARSASGMREKRYKFKFRAEFKNSYRLALRSSGEVLSSKVCCTCDCLLFGVIVATKSKPAHASDGEYVGGATIYFYLKDNESLSNLIYKHPARMVYLPYDGVQNVVFDVPVLCKAYVSYMICVEYVAHAHDESLLLTYMSDKLCSNNANKTKSVMCFGDEPNGSVIKGVCFYEV